MKGLHPIDNGKNLVTQGYLRQQFTSTFPYPSIIRGGEGVALTFPIANGSPRVWLRLGESSTSYNIGLEMNGPASFSKSISIPKSTGSSDTPQLTLSNEEGVTLGTYLELPTVDLLTLRNNVLNTHLLNSSMFVIKETLGFIRKDIGDSYFAYTDSLGNDITGYFVHNSSGDVVGVRFTNVMVSELTIDNKVLGKGTLVSLQNWLKPYISRYDLSTIKSVGADVSIRHEESDGIHLTITNQVSSDILLYTGG